MKRLLVVVDMQADFIDGSLGSPEAQEIVPAVKKKIEEYRKDGGDVVFTLDTHGENYLKTQEGARLPVLHCVKGTNGWEMCEELRDEPGLRFEKGAFGSTELARWAAENNYEQIEIIGLCTDICVISNAMLLKAFLPEARLLVDAACCAGVTRSSHENALAAMKSCQIDIV